MTMSIYIPPEEVAMAVKDLDEITTAIKLMTKKIIYKVMIHLSPEISCDVLQQNVKIKHEN
jgi:hypothetical protein